MVHYSKSSTAVQDEMAQNALLFEAKTPSESFLTKSPPFRLDYTIVNRKDKAVLQRSGKRGIK